MNDDPRKVHRQKSPNCPFIQRHSNNVREAESSNFPGPENVERIAKPIASNLNSTGNGFSTAPNDLESHPLIASSRNIDEYVAKELHLNLTTSQSEGASGSGSNDTRSSKSLHSMHLELIRLETFSNFPVNNQVSKGRVLLCWS